jgi:hypothetical protein
MSVEKIASIDSLMNRYLALGRFSGSVLIKKEGSTLYQQHFGLANYENKTPFTSESRFKVSKEALAKAGVTIPLTTGSTSDKHLATGYLFYNYRGQGMELEAQEIKQFDSLTVQLSTLELARVIESTHQVPIDLSGYLENDGFSYAASKQAAGKTTIIVLSNRRHPVAEEISNSLAATLKGTIYQLPLPRKPSAIDTKLHHDYTGHYSLNEQVKFEVLSLNDSLFVVLGPNKVALIPQSSNQFYMLERDAAMRFLRDTAGYVNRVVLLNGFIESDEIAFKVD